MTKRDGRCEEVMFDKITSRLKKLCYGLQCVDIPLVVQKVINGMFDGVSTHQLDDLAAETAAYLSTSESEYSTLAARICVSNLHKQTGKQFSVVMESLYAYTSPTCEEAPKISKDVIDIIRQNQTILDASIVYDRDFDFDYFGVRTLMKTYLMRLGDKIVERPQHMWMRVAIGIHMTDINSAIETYNGMSQKYFIHATPTLFNAGTPYPQMSSCFLVHQQEDSIDGIYKTLHKCALISKCAGGIGIATTNIRAKGSYIKGSSGTSNGLLPMLRVFDSTARYVDQGGGKRPGAFAVYIEPWHADINDFLEMKKNTGKDEERARDLFYALWIPDLFMKRVENDENWSLFCPHDVADLPYLWGDAFEARFLHYETTDAVRQTISAQKLWFSILDAQIETGNPYMLYKDHVNRKSQQKNVGTITCSNLCTEIMEFTSPDEVAVCNLASIALPSFVANNVFNFYDLYIMTKRVTVNLNKIIDGNAYPVPEAKTSNLRHRPIGIGVQGLADVFCMLHFPFESEQARRLNVQIFEVIYFAALESSYELALKDGAYETFQGSPLSAGQFQFDLWGVEPTMQHTWLDWSELRQKIIKSGVRNSLLVAPMPTASTAQILGNNECFEPFTSNMYTRRVLAGEFAVINKHLIKELKQIGAWSESMRQRIIAADGSVQLIEDIPSGIRDVYKTVWEMKQKNLLQMSIDRGGFVDQSQSLNIFMKNPTHTKLSSAHFFGWRGGLKTGMYYLRTTGAATAVKFTVPVNNEDTACRVNDNEGCTMCSA